MSDAFHDALRAAITEALAGGEHMVTGWVFVYETAGLDDDTGDVGSGWGALKSASNATTIGLCRLAATEFEMEAMADE